MREGLGAPRVDPGQRARLREPPVGTDDDPGLDADLGTVRAVREDAGAGAARTAFAQGGDPVALQQDEPGQPTAGREQFVQQVRLGQGQQAVVRGGQPGVVDDQEHPLPFQHLEAALRRGPPGPRRVEHPELVEDLLTAGLQDLTAERAAQRGGTLDGRHPGPGAQQHEGQGWARGPSPDDTDVGLGRFRADVGPGRFHRFADRPLRPWHWRRAPR